MQKLFVAIHSLKEWSHRGRPGKEPGTRELVLPPLPYVVVYRVRDEIVEIARVFHAAQSR